MNELQSIIKKAIKRELTDKEILYIEWLSRMDYETIDIFSNLFIEAANSKKI